MDTTNKRRSALGQFLPFLVILPEADGALDIPDLRHVAGFYRFGVAVPPLTIGAGRSQVEVGLAAGRVGVKSAGDGKVDINRKRIGKVKIGDG